MHLAAVIVLVAVGISLAVLASTRPSSSGAGAPDEATAIETLPYRDDAVDAPAFDAVAQELTASCTSPSHASWYVFTPVADTPLTAWVIPDRDGSTVLDVALVVWSLTADGSLVEAGCVDDRGAGGAEQLVLTAAGEGTYYVQAAAVDHEGSVGTLTLLADVQRPEHDLFAFARRMETTPYRDEGVDAIGARREPGETIPSCVDLEATTWYRISAPQDLVFSATVDPAPAADNVLDAAMALYAGDTVDALLEVACADSAGVRGKEHLEVPILGGEEYWLQIGAIVGEDSGPGVYTLSVDGLQAIELRPVPDTFLGAAPLMVDAEVTSGLPVTLAVEGPCRISDGALVAEGAGLCTITASQEGDSTWAPAVPVTTTLRVSRGRQAIELEPLDRAVVGVPLSVQATADSGLPVVFETSGSCRVAQGTLLADGSGTCTITASQPGDADWAPAEPVTTSVLVGRGQQEIELDLPRATRTGAVPLELVATTSSGLPVALEADGPCRLGDDGLVATGAGACTITATQDGDVDWAPAEPVTTTLRIGRGRQSIELEPIDEPTFGDPPLELMATTSSGLPVALEADGPCRLGDDGLVATGAGACTITATQGGDVDWAPAEPVSRRLTIAPAGQAIELVPIDDVVVGGSAVLAATSDSGLPVALEASGPCLLDGSLLRALGTGACTITASQGGDADWAPAEPVTTTLRIGRGRQSIELEPIDEPTFGDPPLELSATTSSGLPVALEADGPCRLGDDGLVATGAGACTITATQDGDVDWAPAEPVTTTLRIGRGRQSIELEPIDEPTFGDPPLELMATTSSGLPVALEADGPCRLGDDGLVATGAGACTITATQGGDVDWAPAEPVSRRLTIAPAGQAIELVPIDDVVVGGSAVLAATSDSGLPVALEASGPCLLDGSLLRALGTGACTITASQGGDADWAPAEPVTTTLRIGRGRQSIELEPIDEPTFGDPPLELNATSDSGLPVALEADGPCRLGDDGLVATGAGACTITATQDGDVDWAPAEPVTTTLRIGRGRQSIELEPIDERLLGDGPVELQAASSSGLPITYSAEGPCDVKDGILKLRDAGRCTVTASQPGGGDWEPADASTSFRIVGPITDRRQDMTGNVAMSPPGTLLGDGAQITAGFEPDGPQTHYFAIALDESEVLEIAVSQPGTAWSIAEPTALTTGETTWQDIEIDPETSVARWVANESGIHSIRVTGDGPGPDDGSTYTMQVRVDPDSRDEAESALLDSVRSFKCKLLTNRDREAFVAGALAGVRCLRPRPDVYELQLYTFPDGQRLRALHRARVDEVSPELVATADACRLGQRGVTTWAHGRVACWTPDGQMRAVLHWTDLRTNTYGILRTDVEANRRRFARWRALRETIA